MLVSDWRAPGRVPARGAVADATTVCCRHFHLVGKIRWEAWAVCVCKARSACCFGEDTASLYDSLAEAIGPSARLLYAAVESVCGAVDRFASRVGCVYELRLRL